LIAIYAYSYMIRLAQVVK